jgi:hypothetical protein
LINICCFEMSKDIGNAKGLAKLMERNQVVLAGANSSELNRVVSYESVSAILDVIVMDIGRACPDAYFTGNDLYLNPTVLKGYLYCHVIDFFFRGGSLSVQSGTALPPTTVGYELPNALLAWLSYLGPYVEGTAKGVCQFAITASPVTGTAAGLVATGPSQATIGNAILDVPRYALDPTYKEWIRDSSATITSVDLPTLWSTYASNYSNILRNLPYPTAMMPSTIVQAPDGSAFTYPYVADNSTDTIGNCSHVTNPFCRWNEEIGILYNYESLNMKRRAFGNVRAAPEFCQQYGLNMSGVAQSTTARARVLRENFVFIMRFCDYEFGADLSNTLNFQGAQLRTLNIVPRFVSSMQYKDTMLTVYSQLLRTQTVGPGADQLNTIFLAAAAAVQFRLNRLNPRTLMCAWLSGPGDTVIGPQNVPMSQAWQNLRLPLLASQAIAELGCAINKGQLFCPVPAYVGHAWFYSRTGTRPATSWNPDSVWDFNFTSSAPQVPSWTWETQTLNAAWQTGYEALSGFVLTPNNAGGRIMSLAVSGLTAGAGFGRSDLVYPVTNNPFGGVCVLVDVFHDQGTNDEDIDMGSSGWQYKRRMYSTLAVGSNIAIGGVDMAVALFCSWHNDNTTTVQDKKDALISYKYCLEFTAGYSSDVLVTSLANATTNPGGSVVTMLSDAMMRRHSDLGSIGVMSRNDDLDACLWDALKGVIATGARLLEPVGGIIAGAACNAFVPGSGFICSNVAEHVLSVAKDLGTTATNRNAPGSKGEKIAEIAKDVNQSIKKGKNAPEQQVGHIKVDYKQGPSGPVAKAKLIRANGIIKGKYSNGRLEVSHKKKVVKTSGHGKFKQSAVPKKGNPRMSKEEAEELVVHEQIKRINKQRKMKGKKPL